MSEETNGGYFAIIPANVLHDGNLSSSEKLFYGDITRLSNKYGYCYASNKFFADLHSVKKPTISMWVKKLQDCGYIKVEHIYKDNQIIQRKIYPLINSNVVSEFDHRGVVRKSKGGWSENRNRWSENRNDINKHDKQISDIDISIHHFDEFWDLYGKKVERRKCENKWKKLSKDDVDAIMQFVPIYKKSVSSQQYQKNPFTFLNSRIWEDDWDNYKPRKNEKPIRTNGQAVGRMESAYQQFAELFGNTD